jgi:hypothetical protein
MMRPPCIIITYIYNVRPPCIVITCIYNELPPQNPGRTAPILLLIDTPGGAFQTRHNKNIKFIG